MRELFKSERRYIRNVLQQCGIAFDGPVDVVREHYYPMSSTATKHFNIDFMLEFIAADELKDFKSHCASVLPNTLGAEVFVTIDVRSSRPLLTELISGEAFPIRYFKTYILAVEATLGRSLLNVNLGNCAFCRIFVVGNDICFLASPTDRIPAQRGQRSQLRTGEEESIDAYFEGNELVCVDGWIRTEVKQSEWKLVATPEDS